jgi:GH15 family glucan-1,4-alpha-glucosidase
LSRHRGDPAPYLGPAAVAVRYLLACWELPCYDWWEEHPERYHVSTLGSIVAGLGAALELGLLDKALAAETSQQLDLARARLNDEGAAGGHLVKWLGTDAVDGSLLACLAPFDVVGDAVARATLARVEEDLVVDNGVFRYRDDTFYGGGRWPVLAGFLGLTRLRLDRPEAALAALGWMASTATGQGELPEQVSGPLLHPERFDEWRQRWGPVATPLLWSHGMYLVLADELGLHG